MYKAIHWKSPMLGTASLLIVKLLLIDLHSSEAQIGVCYGMKGDNLPSAQDVVNLYVKYGIGAMRLYESDLATLQALQGTNIKLMLGVLNEDIQGIASDQSTADDWVQTNVVPYAASIKYIVVGNEIRPLDEQASSVEPAMQNILNALNSNYLGSQIMISTAVDTSLIDNSYPPSHAQFKNLTYITPIINFLENNNWPLLANIQPYAAYINDPENIELDFALFKKRGTVFVDDNGKKIFNAIYDAMYVATQKVVTPQDPYANSLYGGKATVKLVGSETGWSSGGFKPRLTSNVLRMKGLESGGLLSDGEDAATLENAKAYYTNLIKHVKKGTPLTPGQEIEIYLFAMFDENLKPGDVTERYYGICTPEDLQFKYGMLNF